MVFSIRGVNTSGSVFLTSYEENNPRDVPMGLVMDVLRGFFPDLREPDVSFLYHGTYNVFDVGGEYIFRFPDRSLFDEAGLGLLRREGEVLNLLRPHLSVEVPRFEFLSDDPGMPFAGYRKIAGVSLSRCLREAGEAQRASVARRIG
jgi:hypothetical protein